MKIWISVQQCNRSKNILIKNCACKREAKWNRQRWTCKLMWHFTKRAFILVFLSTSSLLRTHARERVSECEWCCAAESIYRVATKEGKRELKCVAMWHYYWQYYYHQVSDSTLGVRFESSFCLLFRLFVQMLSLSLAMCLRRSPYGTHKCCHQFFFRDALHVIICHF